jgi:hypothetical protein
LKKNCNFNQKSLFFACKCCNFSSKLCFPVKFFSLPCFLLIFLNNHPANRAKIKKFPFFGQKREISFKNFSFLNFLPFFRFPTINRNRTSPNHGKINRYPPDLYWFSLSGPSQHPQKVQNSAGTRTPDSFAWSVLSFILIQFLYF